ncbi:MAG: efflux RND transporter periplasmic adaptor subunit [Planctomycetota bacterium]|jgi:RND family efflux transporter MFP subunit
MRAILCCVAALAAAMLGACDRQTPTAAPPAPEVTVALPLQRDTVINADFTGSLEAIESVKIQARVEGYLQSILFDASAEVEAGQALFVIDPAPFQAALEAAEADLALRQANRDQARWDLERTEELAERQASNPKEVLDARTKLAMTTADVKAAQARVDSARLDLGYTDIRSPIDGRVSRNYKDVGNLVGAGERTLLTTVVKMDELYCYFNVPERLVLERMAAREVERRRDPDRPFFIGLAHETGFPHEGRLDYIDNTVDTATGTITVRGIVPNDDELLFPGAFVRVRVPGGVKKDAVLVDERAIGTDLGGKYVLVVVEDNIVEHRRVTLGQLEEGMRVIEAGLGPDERYIVTGLQRARPGLPVTPKTAEDAEPSGS